MLNMFSKIVINMTIVTKDVIINSNYIKTINMISLTNTMWLWITKSYTHV
jgi:hypothetical protein